jgi:hypothetical protein
MINQTLLVLVCFVEVQKPFSLLLLPVNYLSISQCFHFILDWHRLENESSVPHLVKIHKLSARIADAHITELKSLSWIFEATLLWLFRGMSALKHLLKSQLLVFKHQVLLKSDCNCDLCFFCDLLFYLDFLLFKFHLYTNHFLFLFKHLVFLLVTLIRITCQRIERRYLCLISS